MIRHLPFVATIIVLAFFGVIFGREIARVENGAVAAAIAVVVLGVAYYRYLKASREQRPPYEKFLEVIALTFVGGLLLYVIDYVATALH